jgi:hypothetical protein
LRLWRAEVPRIGCENASWEQPFRHSRSLVMPGQAQSRLQHAPRCQRGSCIGSLATSAPCSLPASSNEAGGCASPWTYLLHETARPWQERHAHCLDHRTRQADTPPLGLTCFTRPPGPGKNADHVRNDDSARGVEARGVEPLFPMPTSAKIQERLYRRGLRESKQSWKCLDGAGCY